MCWLAYAGQGSRCKVSPLNRRSACSGQKAQHCISRSSNHVSYLYNLIIATDGNFQLKLRAHAGGDTDAVLGTGLCIVVSEEERQK
jgi:hypothetical protein